MTNATALHDKAILIDELDICAWDRGIFEEYRKGGVVWAVAFRARRAARRPEAYLRSALSNMRSSV